VGFKSVMKKVGKVALKVAPYAAMAIPGVGIPLGMALQGGLAAANAKASGGNWKQALLAGGIGAGTGAIAGGALKGIGPSSGALAKFGAGAGGKLAGTGLAGAVGSGLGTVGQGYATNYLDNKLAGSGGGNKATGQQVTTHGSEGGIGPSEGFQYGPTNPNLSQALARGKRTAIMNQPFRSGYNVMAPNTDTSEGQPPTKVVATMPPIYSTGGNRRRQQQAAY
jgi:hypothetical protein